MTATVTTPQEPPAQAPDRTSDQGRPAGWLRSLWQYRRQALSLRFLLPVLVLALVATLVWRFAVPHPTAGYVVPQNSAMEAGLGIRFNQVDIVGDGGLVELGYTVLDPERASEFQSDTHHPPLLHSEARNGVVSISALMKQGHSLRAGQTYFIIYENPRNTIRPGELVSVEYKGQWLKHVPAR